MTNVKIKHKSKTMQYAAYRSSNRLSTNKQRRILKASIKDEWNAVKFVVTNRTKRGTARRKRRGTFINK